MADDFQPQSPSTWLAADDTTSGKVQRVKLTFGVDGVATDVSSSNPLPVTGGTGGGGGGGDPSSTGTPASAPPATVSVIGGTDGSVVRRVLTDTSGRQIVNIGTAPTITVTGALTDTQLRASAVPVSAASLPLPAGAATAANQTGVASTTREYAPASGYRAAVAATATTIALSGNVTLSASREVRVHATTACWLRFATAGTGQDAAVPASGSATTGGMPIEANQPEVIRIPASCTHLSVIRDSADGTITFTPVA